MRTSRRRVLLALVGLALAAAALIALGWFPQEPLRRLVEARVQQALGPDARIGRLRVWPGRLYAEIEGLVVATPTYRLEAKTVRVRIKRELLWGQSIALGSLEADGVDLYVDAAAPSPPSSSPLPAIVIDRVRVTNGTLSVALPDGRQTLARLEGLALDGGIGQGALTASATGGRWEGERPVALGPSSARVRLSPLLDVHVESFEAGLQRSRVSASGPLGRVGAWRPDLAWSARADLAELAEPAGLGDAAGMLRAQGTLRLPPEGLQVVADVTGEALRRGEWSADTVNAHVEHAPALTVARLEARLLDGSASATATLKDRDLRGRVVANGLDLARLPAGGSLTGRASGTADVAGDVDRYLAVDARVTADGRSGTTPFRVELLADGPMPADASRVDLDWAATGAAGDASASIDFQASGVAQGTMPPVIEGRLEGTLRTPRTGALPVEADISAGGPFLEATAVVQGLGEPVNVSLRLAPGGCSPDDRVEVHADAVALDRLVPGLTGHARLDVVAEGPWATASGRASVQLEDAAWRGVAVGPATLEATADYGAGHLELRVPEWNVSGQADVDPDGPRRLRGRVDLRETPLDRLAPLLPEGPPLTGALTARLDLDVPLMRPKDAVVTTEVESLAATRGPLRVRNDGPARFTWRGRAVEVERLQLAGDGFAARASGRVGLADATTLDLRIAGEAELETLPVPEAWTLAGRVSADLQVAGTSTKPSVTGDVAFEDAGVSGPSLPPVAIPGGRVQLAGDTLVLPDLALRLAGGQATLAGRVPLAAAWPAARARRDRVADAEGADVRIAWAGVRAEEWPQGGGHVAGALDGTLAIAGGLASIGEVRARLEVPATVLRVDETEVRIDPFGATLADGRVETDAILVSAADSALQLEGGADLARRTLTASALGAINLRALSPFLQAAAASGVAELDVSASGPWNAPQVQGSLLLDDASVRLRLLPQAVTSLNARVDFDGGSLRIARATAVLGGGDLTLSGSARLAGGLADAQFALTGRDVTLAYPPGLRSRLDADLTLRGGPQSYLLAGDVRALRGLYDLDLVFEQGLSQPQAAADSPALRRFALDLRVEIQNAIQVRNNMTELQAVGALRVRGDMNAPAPVGNLEIEPAGKVYLGSRAFEIKSGRLTYDGTWDPTIEIEAADLIKGADANGLSNEYEVTVRLVGSLDQPGLRMSSDPPLSEGQIVSLIATGRTDGGSAALRLAVGGQAATLLAGRLTRRLRDLGLDEVSIQPELVAREGQAENETGARFTFGKRLSSRLELIYSLSLQDPEARFILVEARPGLDVVLRGQRSDAGTYTGSVGQRFQFGGGRRRKPASADRRVRLTAVRFDGDVPLPEAEMLSLAKVKTGQRKTVWDLQDNADRLRARLIERGYVEAETGVRIEDGAAVFRVRTGARYEWRVDGMSSPPDLTKRVRESLFEEEALERGQEVVLDALRGRGHLRARVRTSVEPGQGTRTLVFTAEPGARYDPVDVEFPGARSRSASRLLKDAGGAGRLVADPGGAARAIQDEYHRAFFLAAQVDPPRVSEVGPSGLRIEVPVREGPRATLGEVRFEGTTRPLDRLQRAVALRPGAPYDPARALAATDRLREHYFRQGYGNVRVQAAAVPRAPDIDLVFTVEEGRRAVLGQVVIQGLRRTRESLVRRQVRLRPGAPLDPRRLATLERELLDMGLFSRVLTSVSADDPATLTITLEEDDRYLGRYALSFEDKRNQAGDEQPNFLEKSTAEVDGEVRNLLGWGASLGARARVGADVRDASVSLGIPSIPVLGKLTASLFRIQEDLPATADPDTGARRENQRTRDGFEVTWTRRVFRRTDLLYGYRFDDTELVSPDLGDPVLVRKAALRASVLRDTRDSILDARRGRFATVSVDYSPRFVTADFTFVKGLAQLFLARPVGESFTWAHGYRLGLAKGFGGQNIRPTERFDAGGGNTLRGFETDSVGPFDPVTRTFLGGEAVVIVNQELRYHHPSGLGAVAFYDGGNVFRKVGDVDLDWRHSIGVGLRWSSPVGLLRVDLGLPLARRVLAQDPLLEEARYQVFFSIGQAF